MFRKNADDRLKYPFKIKTNQNDWIYKNVPILPTLDAALQNYLK